MKYSKITAKGQTTVPKEVRDALGLKPGDRVTYEVREGTVTLKRQPTFRDIAGMLKGKGKRPYMGPEAEKEAIRRGWLGGDRNG